MPVASPIFSFFFFPSGAQAFPARVSARLVGTPASGAGGLWRPPARLASRRSPARASAEAVLSSSSDVGVACKGDGGGDGGGGPDLGRREASAAKGARPGRTEDLGEDHDDGDGAKGLGERSPSASGTDTERAPSRGGLTSPSTELPRPAPPLPSPSATLPSPSSSPPSPSLPSPSPVCSPSAASSSSSSSSSDDSDVLIEFVNVHKWFGSKHVLAGASFKIRRGEAVGIIGASGTGKSTTLRIAAGILEPDAGQVKIRGVPRVGLLSDQWGEQRRREREERAQVKEARKARAKRARHAALRIVARASAGPKGRASVDGTGGAVQRRGDRGDAVECSRRAAEQIEDRLDVGDAEARSDLHLRADAALSLDPGANVEEPSDAVEADAAQAPFPGSAASPAPLSVPPSSLPSPSPSSLAASRTPYSSLHPLTRLLRRGILRARWALRGWSRVRGDADEEASQRSGDEAVPSRDAGADASASPSASSSPPSSSDLKIGLVFQSGALFDGLTVGENVGFLLYEHSALSQPEIDAEVAAALANVGLPNAERLMPSQLSGGMKKRVALARAIARDVRHEDEERVVLYDEPTAGLDPVASTVVEDLIRSVHAPLGRNEHQERDGIVQMPSTTPTTATTTTTSPSNPASQSFPPPPPPSTAQVGSGGIRSYVVVTHQQSTIRRAVDRLIFLHEGRVVWEGPVSELDTCQVPVVKQFATGSRDGPITYV